MPCPNWGIWVTHWMDQFFVWVNCLVSRPGLQFGCLLKNELMLSRKDVLLNWELNTTASATVAVRIWLYPYWMYSGMVNSAFSDDLFSVYKFGDGLKRPQQRTKTGRNRSAAILGSPWFLSLPFSAPFLSLDPPCSELDIPTGFHESSRCSCWISGSSLDVMRETPKD